VLLLVLIAIVSSFFTEFERVAWRELRLVILEPAALYLMLRTTRLDRKTLWRLVDFFVLGGLIVAVIGLVQYALGINLITAEAGLHRLRSVYGSPNNVGLYLGRVLPLLIAIPLFARHRLRRLLYALAAVPVGLALLLSFSKGALLLGIPASLLTMGLLAGGRWFWITVGGIIIAAAASIPLLSHPRFASLLDTQGGTTFFRLKLWQATITMIRDHPWLGVGLDNFLYQYRGRYILPEAWQEPDLSHPHNFLLDHWARLGVFGAIAGVWLQVAFWRITLPLRRMREPDRRALALGLMGAMADTLAHGIVDHSFFLIDLAFAFFLFLGLAYHLQTDQSDSTASQR
jgi:O-antigen ligase